MLAAEGDVLPNRFFPFLCEFSSESTASLLPSGRRKITSFAGLHRKEMTGLGGFSELRGSEPLSPTVTIRRDMAPLTGGVGVEAGFSLSFM